MICPSANKPSASTYGLQPLACWHHIPDPSARGAIISHKQPACLISSVWPAMYSEVHICVYEVAWNSRWQPEGTARRDKRNLLESKCTASDHFFLLESLVVVEELRLVLELHGPLPHVRLHRVHGDGGALLEDGAAQRSRESAKSEVAGVK